MLAQKLMGSVGGASDRLYVDDVFSTYLYTGNGGTQTINNGIDLAGKGGMVWIKARSSPLGHAVYDTARGVGTSIITNNTLGAFGSAGNDLTAFSSNGFSVAAPGYNVEINSSYVSYTSWTFRKSPKFFDVVTYTGNGVAGRQIAHDMGVAPGMVIVKETNIDGEDWAIYHVSQGATKFLILNSTQAVGTGSYWNNTPPTATNFTVTGNGAGVNTSGNTYVAYLFAHDPSADGIIQCGSFTTDGSGNATVTTGWEPQHIMFKRTDSTSNWFIRDSIRGWHTNTLSQQLYANLSEAEASGGAIYPTATGLRVAGLNASSTWIYKVIRRPNKPPTSGTQVYNAIARTGTGAAATVTGVGFAPDVIFNQQRNAVQGNVWYDRLRGATRYLAPASTALEGVNSQAVTSFDMGGMSLGTEASVNGVLSLVHHFFKRAPGFMDVVCYTGDGTSQKNQNHNLGVAPELRITKNRSSDSPGHWEVVVGAASTMLYLESNSAQVGSAGGATSTTFPAYKQSGFDSNTSGVTFVTYLFASLPGISKVGSYTGNGTTQTINCGFTTGARFVLIKRTDSTGDWYVWDTARGIVSANDPHLSINTTASEVTTDDSVDPANSGFIVNQVAATNINVAGGSYIFLAIS